jgi:thioredoxin 1
MSKVQQLTDKTFDEAISEGITLVDFWAEWCGPCRMLSPILEELSEETDVTIAKVNVDDNPDTAAKYGVRSIPTVIAFKDSNVVEQYVGVKTKSMYLQVIETIKSA